MFNWFKTDTEIKRDEYWKLYERLQDAKNDHDRIVRDAESAYSSYRNAVPFLSENVIPSNDFTPARRRLNDDFNQYLNDEKAKRTDLVRAINRAYDQYLHYRNQAIREEQEAKK
ncbi:hypothetical protein [Halalkalibacter hemicellulosilyticus]|uniref:Uncharacterized protein n=1 Tax=Halalkalibacter hemicellulosilyticusJCM 9152 TaxID=1236971 RepID=W4QDT5_9BACI|nr:hypothetical protein [Halalkalibacter hemicellulosilyticus]GAE29509.1 hypothetical protein JCM9152_870 [Halalkalibacter hemicellulosilyticusJCM 9152]